MGEGEAGCACSLRRVGAELVRRDVLDGGNKGGNMVIEQGLRTVMCCTAI